MYFKILNSSSVSINVFFKIFIDSFLINGFCKIQSENVRWDRIKVEPALKSEKITLMKRITSVYGVLSEICDPRKGFQFDIYPAKGGSIKRLYIRGIPDSFVFFDSADNVTLKETVQSIEKLFLTEIGTKDCSFQFVTLSKADIRGIEFVTAAEAARLHVFSGKQSKKLNKKTSSYVQVPLYK